MFPYLPTTRPCFPFLRHRLGRSIRELSRPKDEPIDKCFFRIQKSAAQEEHIAQAMRLTSPAPTGTSPSRSRPPPTPPASAPAPAPAPTPAKGKRSRRGDPPVALPAVELREGRTVVDPSTFHASAWTEGRTLYIAGVPFPVVLNPPTVTTVTPLVEDAVVGRPIRVRLSVEHADLTATRFVWEIRENTGVDPRKDDDVPLVLPEVDPAAWRPWCEGPEVVPGDHDVGQLIRVTVTPSDGFGRSGESVRKEWPRPVRRPLGSSPSPGMGTPVPRAPGTDLRFLTYNLLADQYASTEHAMTNLFGYCDPEALRFETRKQELLREILEVDADVLALQECDEKAFGFFVPYLEARGYEGVFAKKAGRVSEGCTLFWKRKAYRLRTAEALSMRDLVGGDNTTDNSDKDNSNSNDHHHTWMRPEMRTLADNLCDRYPHLRLVLANVPTILQIVTLDPIVTTPSSSSSSVSSDSHPAPPLVVANTHLFFHPQASHVRTLHVHVMLGEIHHRARALSTSPQHRAAILWAGDFNADLNDGLPGVAALLENGSVPANYWDWRDIDTFSWDRKKEEKEEDTAAASEASTPVVPEDRRRRLSPPWPSTTWLPRLDTDADADADVGVSTSRSGKGVLLTSPCRLYAAGDYEAPWTNYVRTYRGHLDYLWVDRALATVVAALPLPSVTDITRETALPSTRYPSDHLPVAFDLRFVTKPGRVLPITTTSRDPNPNPNSPNISNLISISHHGVDDHHDPDYRGLLPDGICALAAGELVGLPTETVYGVAADATDEIAVGRLRRLKGRSPGQPIAIAVPTLEAAVPYAVVPARGTRLREALEVLLPGPVTPVLRRRPENDGDLARAVFHESHEVETDRTGPMGVGIRIPELTFARVFLAAYGRPVALSSANLSGQAAAARCDEMGDIMDGLRVAYDAGEVGGLASTVVDLTVEGTFTLLRRGEGCQRVVDQLTAAGLVEGGGS